MSWATRVRRDDLATFQIDGTGGSAVAGLTACRVQPRATTPRPVWDPETRQPMDFLAQWQEVPDTEPAGNAFRTQWEQFIRHVVDDAPYRGTLVDAAKGVQLVDAALRSSRERRWIDVPALSL
jgi:predicted dehydrogenase